MGFKQWSPGSKDQRTESFSNVRNSYYNTIFLLVADLTRSIIMLPAYYNAAAEGGVIKALFLVGMKWKMIEWLDTLIFV